jgi:hypothetical protein
MTHHWARVRISAEAMPALLVSTSDMKREWIPDRVALVLEAALQHLFELGVVAAGFGVVALMYSLGLLRG